MFSSLKARLAWTVAAPFCLLAPLANAATPSMSPFVSEIAAAKASVMADPAKALAHALAAERAVPRDGSTAAELQAATARWLEAEALFRLDRAAESLDRASSARRSVERIAPNSKLLGDVLICEGYASENSGKPALALDDFQKANKILGQRRLARPIQDTAGNRRGLRRRT